MFYKRLGSTAVLLMLLVFPVSASMVSILVVETGVNERVSTGQFSSIWEGGLMAAFFDAGHIVTNSPIERMERRPGPNLNGRLMENFHEAINGGADYFVLGLIEYNTREGNALPVGIVLQLFDSMSGRMIYEQRFPAVTGRSNNEEFQIAQNAGRVIISQIRGR